MDVIVWVVTRFECVQGHHSSGGKLAEETLSLKEEALPKGGFWVILGTKKKRQKQNQYKNNLYCISISYTVIMALVSGQKRDILMSIISQTFPLLPPSTELGPGPAWIGELMCWGMKQKGICCGDWRGERKEEVWWAPRGADEYKEAIGGGDGEGITHNRAPAVKESKKERLGHQSHWQI